MLHLIGVFVLLMSAAIALTQKEEDRFSIVFTGGLIGLLLIVGQLIFEFI